MASAISGYKYYKTKQGDTYDMIALALWDDEKMASYIIKENPLYMDTLIFDAGVILNIPIIAADELPGTLPPWRR